MCDYNIVLFPSSLRDAITSTQNTHSDSIIGIIITSTSSGDAPLSVIATSQSPTTTSIVHYTNDHSSEDVHNISSSIVVELSDYNSEATAISPTATTNDVNPDKPVEQVDSNQSNITGVIISITATSGSGDQVTMSDNSIATPTPHNHTSDGNNVTSDEYYDGLSVDDDALPTQQPPVAATGQQKSSVLIRLSNRIKELEVNMSLFGDYLEQFRTRCVQLYVCLRIQYVYMGNVPLRGLVDCVTVLDVIIS